MMSIQMLKQKLISETEFEAIFSAFYDLVEQNPIVGGGSRESENDLLRELVLVTAKQIARYERLKFVNFRLLDVPNSSLQHGVAITNKRQMLVFFFFHDINKGMLSMGRNDENEVTLARITGVSPRVPSDSNVNLN